MMATPSNDVHCVNDVTPGGTMSKHHIIASNIIMRSITSFLPGKNII